MPRLQRKSLDTPDTVREFPHGRMESVSLDEIVIGHVRLEPGWRWSHDVRPIVGTEWCQVRHVGICLEGSQHVELADGTTMDIGPGDAFEIPPGHDAWVKGDTACVGYEWAGSRVYARRLRSGSRARPPRRPEPAASCNVGICAYGSAFQLWIENRNAIVATVTVDIPVRQNLDPSVALPVEVTVPAGQTVEALHLSQVDPKLAYEYRFTRRSYLGSLQTTPDEAVRYAVPFGGGEPRRLGQGIDGGVTHVGIYRYAFDFVMPIGTPVLAAREGVVVIVTDGFTEGALDKRLWDKANKVVIAHADGTLATYMHLSPGILVSVGQHVVQGQRLGLSGNSGYTKGPHLHFQVGKVSGEIEGYTIPIRFDDGSQSGLIPEKGQLYGPGSERRG